MLQLIGFLGCLYLFVKGFEIVSNAAYRGEDGYLKGTAAAAAFIAFLGAALFAAAFYFQAQGVGDALSGASSYSGEDSGFNVDNLATDNLIVNDTTLDNISE